MAATLHWKRPLTRPERIAYAQLRHALPDRIVLPQVSFSRFLWAQRSRRDRQILVNLVRQKSLKRNQITKPMSLLDLIRCDPPSFGRQVLNTHRRARCQIMKS